MRKQCVREAVYLSFKPYERLQTDIGECVWRGGGDSTFVELVSLLEQLVDLNWVVNPLSGTSVPPSPPNQADKFWIGHLRAHQRLTCSYLGFKKINMIVRWRIQGGDGLPSGSKFFHFSFWGENWAK